MINKKINNLQSESDNHEQEISYIKDIISQLESDKAEEKVVEEPKNTNDNREEGGHLPNSKDFNDLKRKVDEIDRR